MKLVLPTSVLFLLFTLRTPPLQALVSLFLFHISIHFSVKLSITWHFKKEDIPLLGLLTKKGEIFKGVEATKFSCFSFFNSVTVWAFFFLREDRITAPSVYSFLLKESSEDSISGSVPKERGNNCSCSFTHSVTALS